MIATGGENEPIRQRVRSSSLGRFALHATGWAVVVLLMSAGCARYRYGTAALFRQDIRTVHVPIVRTDSFRVELGPQFTEVLQKRIEERTPFKLADESTADSVFICRIIDDSKQVVTETRTDEVRDLLVGISIETVWTDRLGNVLMQTRFLPPGESAFFFAENSHLVPEGGQSIATSHLRAMERLADHVVDQMESRWGQ